MTYNAANATCGSSIFSGCTHSCTLAVGNNVTALPDYLFQDFTGLNNVSSWGGVTGIGRYTFSGCGFTSLAIPDAIVVMGSNAFQGCASLATLTFGNGLSAVSDNAFSGCSSLSSITWGGVTSIGARAFESCTGLTSVAFPGGMESIGREAFMNTGLTSLELDVPSVGEGAFWGCTGLASLTVGADVASIGSAAFAGCSSLANGMVLRSESVPESGYGIFNNTANNLIIYVPGVLLSAYKSVWSDYRSHIQGWLQKSVVGYGENNDNWTFVASPLVENENPTAVDNLITETEYDFYRFNQSATMEWQNYKTHTSDFVLANGQGYLYANAEDVNLMFKGTFNENETEEVGLIYDAGNPFAGWNLVGNPFPVQAYANRSYYVMNEDGTGIEPVAVSSEVAIEPCTGVMVKAEVTETNPKVTFSKTAPDSQGNQGVLQIAVAQNNMRGTSTGSVTVMDKVIVSFNEGDALGKFVFNEDNAKLWIPCGNENFAIVCAEKTGEMPLNFEAKEDGAYTISITPENVEMDYLHLIDNLTGADVDLLQTPEYTFDARKSDYTSRFKLVFATNEENGPSTGSGTFAFYNGNEWVISNTGETTLQIVDMMGRLMSSEPINGNATMNLNQTPGVYMLRLVSGDSVKVQKVVVR